MRLLLAAALTGLLWLPAETAAQQPPSQATPQEATPQEATPQKATPQEATPSQATPSEEKPQEATPQETTPQEATPQEATPQEATPQEATPQEATPQEAKPQETTPQEATPQEATPQEATPQEATPQEATPQEATPQEATPQEATPQEATPQEATPQEAKPQETTPQEATPSQAKTLKPLKSPEDVPQIPISELLAGFRTERRGERIMVELSVAQLLQLTLKVNLSLAALRLQEQEARILQKGARGIFDFRLKLESEDATQVQAQLDSASDTNYLNLTNSKVRSQLLELNKPTRLGLNYTLSHSRSETESTPYQVGTAGEAPTAGTAQDPFHTQETEARVTLPLRKGAGWRLNTIPLRQADLALASQLQNNLKNEQELLKQVAILYWRMVAVQETLQARLQAVKVAEGLLKDTRIRFNVGNLARVDLQSSQVRLANRQQEALAAELDVLEIENLIQVLLNLSNVRIGLIPKDIPGKRDLSNLKQGQLLENLRKTHPDLALLNLQLQQTQLQLLQAKNNSRSQLDLELFYTEKGYGDSSASSSERHSTQNDRGVKLSWDLPLWGRQSKSERASRLLKEQRTILAIRSKRSDLETELLGKIRQLRLQKGSIAQAEAGEKLARSRLKTEVQRFRVGRSTNTSVTQAQNEFTTSQVSTIVAKTRFEEAYLELITLSGYLHSTFGLKSSYAPPSN